jgi:exo-beta-1,3-glucanase (GH17 family)
LRASIKRLRAKLPNTAIATSEPFYFYLNNDPPDFVDLQDFLLPSVHPLYETWFPKATTEQSVDFVVQVANRLSAQTEKPLLIKETGLPSGPSARGFTPARQAEFWRTLSDRLPQAPGLGLVYFEAFDHAWKVENAQEEFGFQPEEAYWGFYTESGQPKPVVMELQGIWRTQNNPHSPLDTPREPALRGQ